MRERRAYDVVVVGAGPAGIAAAVEAAAGGLRVALLDQAPRVGGAFWRHAPEHLDETAGTSLHHDWATFRRLLERLEIGFRLRALRGEVERTPVVLDATSVVVATGTHERVLPFRGWTLPGVVTAGGAQALLKGTLTPPGARVALAGSGPLLLVVADALLRSGVDVAAVAESGHPLTYGLHPRAWSGMAARAREASAYVGTLARHRVPYLAGHTVREARGRERVEGVVLATRRGRRREYDVDALLVSHGFTPALDLLLAVDAATRVDDDGSLVVVVDERQRTSVPGLLAVGEVTGVGGASLALLEGHVAGRALTDRATDPAVLRRVAVHRRFARTMHAVHAPRSGWVGDLPDDELVCRCEEVTAGRVREACRELGVDDVRGAKLMTRAGMGLCQGRVCGRAVADLVAATTGRPAGHDEVAHAGARLPVTPVPLDVLARESLDPSPGGSLGSAHPFLEA